VEVCVFNGVELGYKSEYEDLTCLTPRGKPDSTDTIEASNVLAAPALVAKAFQVVSDSGHRIRISLLLEIATRVTL
jgi:hypothetical protein